MKRKRSIALAGATSNVSRVDHKHSFVSAVPLSAATSLFQSLQFSDVKCVNWALGRSNRKELVSRRGYYSDA
jgi:hypothetical protein